MGDPVYFDTSALAKLVLNEPESAELSRFVEESAGQPVSSAISDVEMVRAVLRSDPSLLDTALEVLAQLVLLPAMDSIRLRAAYLAPTSLGSLDALHLATALEIQTDLKLVVSYDNRLLEAAGKAGFSVISPGA
jgi:predicted nucleic acid-binding protein